MNRKIYHIIFLLTGFVILSSKSCEPDVDFDKEAWLIAEQDTIRSEIKEDFKSEYLWGDRLMVYGEKAKQKLLDFADYLSLYSGKNIDTLFKQQVRDMLYRLFYEKDALVELSVAPTNITGKKPANLNDLLGRIDASNYQSVVFAVSDLKTLEPLHMESPERYTGMLGCTITIFGITASDTILLNETLNTVKILTTRTKKQFGTGASIQIWQVFLHEVDATE